MRRPRCQSNCSRSGVPMTVRRWVWSTPRRRRRHRPNDAPLGTARSLLSPRLSRWWRPGSWPGRVTTRDRVSRHKESTTRRVRGAGRAAPARRQPAPQLRADRSRERPGPVARHLARPRARASGRATRQEDTFPSPDLRSSPVLRLHPRRRVPLQAAAAGPRVTRHPPAPPIPWPP